MPERICLIVDNEPAIRHLLRTILTFRNVQSVEAESAAHALSIVEELRGHIDLLVSDMNTPGKMNGLELAQSVRNAFPWISVILFSGYDDHAPGFDVILKPFLPEAVLNAVDKAMTSPQQRAVHAAAACHG